MRWSPWRRAAAVSPLTVPGWTVITPPPIRCVEAGAWRGTRAFAPGTARNHTSFLQVLSGEAHIQTVGRMALYHFDRNGRFTVTLENCQVWQQLDGDSHQAHWTMAPGSSSPFRTARSAASISA